MAAPFNRGDTIINKHFTFSTLVAIHAVRSNKPVLIELFSCSTQLSIKIQLLIKTKILKNNFFHVIMYLF